MAGCISCVILPLLLFLFHRFIQPLILKFWNPWAIKDDKKSEGKEKMACPFGKISNQNQQQTEDSRIKSD